MEKKSSSPKGDIISVCGYKSLYKEQSIEIKPLTILAGPNSSGKSSIIQPLLLLKQTLENSYDPGALLLYGPNVRITSANQLLSRIGSICSDCFSFKFESRNGWYVKLNFKKIAKKGLDIESINFKHGKKEEEITLRLGMSSSDIESIPPLLSDPFAEILKDMSTKDKKLEWVVSRDRCFIKCHLEAIKESETSKSITLLAFDPTTSLKTKIENLIHVPPQRGNPERTYKTTAVSDQFPGTFEEYVASIIHHWQETRSNKLNHLGQALENLGLTWKINAKAVDDTQVEICVSRLPHKIRGSKRDVVNIADVGFGLSQVLPVIVALLVSKQGQIVYLEEPEIHLHPNAQFYLSNIIAEASKRRVYVVVETHSSLLLRGIQTLVAKGDLSKDLVKLHWFKRDDNGITEVFSSNIDDDGSFGDWPEDFDDVQLYAEKNYLDAVEKRVFQ